MDECVRKEEEGREGRRSAYERERVKEGGPQFTHSVVIDSSCFHSRGILRLFVSILSSGIYL